jgi:parallel beta-helix repeat protein
LLITPFIAVSECKAFQFDSEVFSKDYLSLFSIEINSNDGFNQFPGSGTSEDPFIIEGFNITTPEKYGIYITSITKYFIIRNCYIDSSFQGIYLKDVAKGTGSIENNICKNSDIRNGVGIKVENSENIVVTDNICTDNDLYGILVINSDGSTLINNTCLRNGSGGIVAYFSENSLFYNNSCAENEIVGIAVLHSFSSLVEKNICSKNNDFGMLLGDSNETMF